MQRIRIEDYIIPSADIGCLNPLPDLKTVQYVHAGVTIGNGLTQEDSQYIGYGKVPTILPYMIQDGYSRQRIKRSFHAAILENEHLRAVFLPELGGRLWSLYNKDAGRELLYVNPVFQPCHLALRNAWFSGGVEWNVGIKGHNPLTCDPLHTEIIEHKGLSVLRMYEFERIRRVVYQIEACLPESSPMLYIKVRITNVSGEEVPMYWWTNIAVPETTSTRVIVPACEAFQCLYENGEYFVDKTEMPNIKGLDCSYPANLQRSMDYFHIVPKDSPKWITAVEKDGVGLFEASTNNLFGRKVFQWGMSDGGRHWQEFLSEAGKPYIEIQAGMARTQLEHIPMPPDASWEFVETFGMIKLDPNLAASRDWHIAQEAAESSINKVVHSYDPEKVLALWTQISTLPGKRVMNGSGWGALENRRRLLLLQPAMSTALLFPSDTLGEEQADWLHLLEHGVLPIHSPQTAPVSYMIQKQWLEKLEIAMSQEGGRHWYSFLMLGVLRYAADDIIGARQAWLDSIHEQPSAWAFRNLARLDVNCGKLTQAAEEIIQAQALLPESRHIAQEYGAILIAADQSSAFLNNFTNLPTTITKHPRMQYLKAKALCSKGLARQARSILEKDFVLPDIREGEISLADLWEEINQIEKQTAAKDFVPPPLPYHLNFRMS